MIDVFSIGLMSAARQQEFHSTGQLCGLLFVNALTQHRNGLTAVVFRLHRASGRRAERLFQFQGKQLSVIDII